MKWAAKCQTHNVREYTGNNNFRVEKIGNFLKMGPSLLNIHFRWVGVLLFVTVDLRLARVSLKVNKYFFCKYGSQVLRGTIKSWHQVGKN